MRRQVVGLAGRVLGATARAARAPSAAPLADAVVPSAVLGAAFGRAPLRCAAPVCAGALACRTSYSSAAGPPPAPQGTASSQMQDDFLSGTSAAYLEALEDKFREDPKSVPPSWASFLNQLGE